MKDGVCSDKDESQSCSAVRGIYFFNYATFSKILIKDKGSYGVWKSMENMEKRKQSMEIYLCLQTFASI